MKIVVNSKNPEGISFKLYSKFLKEIEGVVFNDFKNYKKYDVAIFFIYDLKRNDLVKCKSFGIRIGIIDPRNKLDSSIIDLIDFIIVDSVEMKDFYLRYRKPIFIYYEFFYIENFEKTHNPNKKKIVIGYHGNKIHLMSMDPIIINALKVLSLNYEIEFLAIYNFKSLGKWKINSTEGLKIKHLQWTEKNFKFFLENVDIGIVPNLIPINIKIEKAFLAHKNKKFNENDSDYLLRFKVPSGPNRIFSFIHAKIPVVADMYPSAMDIINNGSNGFIAFSTEAWIYYLEKLIKSSALRKKFSNKIYEDTKNKWDLKIQNKKLIKFLNQSETQESFLFKSKLELIRKEKFSLIKYLKKII